MPRLSKVTKELNVGLQTCVDFLQKKGYTVENSLNTKIDDEQYELLVIQFSQDKDVRLKAEQAQRERINNKNEARAAEEPKKAETKKEAETTSNKKEEKPAVSFKVVGKIELDGAKKKEVPEVFQAESEPEAEPAPMVEKPIEEEKAPKVPTEKVEEAPVVEVVKEEALKVSEIKVVETPVDEVVEEKASADPVATDESASDDASKTEPEVFAVKRPEFVSKINVVGKVDLSAINQSTRPKKKTKEEKKKEREEQAAQRKQQNAAAGDGKKKKRARIQNERVDINKAGQQAANENRGNNNNHNNNNNNNSASKNNGGGKGNDSHRAKFDRDKERAKRILDKAEMSEEEIQKQVKDTLARLTNKPKSTGAKHRKEKRNQAADRLQ